MVEKGHFYDFYKIVKVFDFQMCTISTNLSFKKS
jgi:hypothetical protein